MTSLAVQMGVRTLGALAILLAAPLQAQTRAEKPDMPRAYYIAEFEPTVPGAIRPYSERVESTLEPFGGHFIARGGTLEALEGQAPKGVVVIIEFDSLERAQAWYRSPAYAALKPIRQRAGNSRVYIMEGASHRRAAHSSANAGG
ncbi:DUF1330 domain-containing protein [Ralstonia nicotianae]